MLPRLVLLLVSLAMVTLAAELLLRKTGTKPLPPPSPGPLFRTDLKPDNSMGYLEFEYPKEKAPNVFRIIVMGDSFSEGGGISIDDIYPKRLERYLNRFGNETGTVYQVINFSKAGRTTVQELEAINLLLPQVQPDLIVIGYCLNDPEDPYKLHHVLTRFNVHPYRKPRHWRGALCERFKLADFMSRRMSNMKKRHGYSQYFHYLYSDEYIGWQKAKAAWKEIGAVSASRQVPVVAMIFPLFVTDMGPRYKFGDLHEIIHKTLEEVGVQVVDLIPYFTGHQHQFLELVPGVDPHPSERAHRIAAEALWIELRSRGLLPDKKKFEGKPPFPVLSPYLPSVASSPQTLSILTSESSEEAPHQETGLDEESEETSEDEISLEN